MEKLGIITGIGNIITPEIDAVINNYIVGKNTILKGLELQGNKPSAVLSAGVCQLLGYRGVLEENISNINENYIYGKFVIGLNETDSFSVVITDNTNDTNDGIVNPLSITNAGIYYLRLYVYNEIEEEYLSQVGEYKYPARANISDRADYLQGGGGIDATAITETANVNAHETQPYRVANTEYVHNQIVAEIDEENTNVNIYLDTGGGSVNYYISGLITIRRKARQVIVTQSQNFEGELHGNSAEFSMSGELGIIPNGYRPLKTEYGCLIYKYKNWGSIYQRSATIKIETSGKILTSDDIRGTDYEDNVQSAIISFGYECE